MDSVSKGYCQKTSRLPHQYLNTMIIPLIKIHMQPDRYKMLLCMLSQHLIHFFLVEVEFMK
jgi:hypothetical protein